MVKIKIRENVRYFGLSFFQYKTNKGKNKHLNKYQNKHFETFNIHACFLVRLRWAGGFTK